MPLFTHMHVRNGKKIIVQKGETDYSRTMAFEPKDDFRQMLPPTIQNVKYFACYFLSSGVHNVPDNLYPSAATHA